MDNNIFSGYGLRTQFVNLIYTELMNRTYVSYEGILRLFYARESDYYETFSYRSENGYGELKKAFSLLVNTLNEKIPNCILDNGKKGKGKAIIYVGEDTDPLKEERQYVAQKSIEDYVKFCKASAGILPSCWFSSFFENTQLLLETHRDKERGNDYIHSSLDQELKNIELLPLFHRAILEERVLEFFYQPFGQEQFKIQLHPQYLKEYNGRWFVFGQADRKPYQAYNVPLDRIVGEISEMQDIIYQKAPKYFYKEYFDAKIGVSHNNGDCPTLITIRTHSMYMHGLVTTKKIHHSQVESLPFGVNDDGEYGEISLFVEPNREFFGKILNYGCGLEIISPIDVRETIKGILKKQIDNYL